MMSRARSDESGSPSADSVTREMRPIRAEACRTAPTTRKGNRYERSGLSNRHLVSSLVVRGTDQAVVDPMVPRTATLTITTGQLGLDHDSDAPLAEGRRSGLGCSLFSASRRPVAPLDLAVR